MSKGTFEVKVGLAEMLKGGVIMDVTTQNRQKLQKMRALALLWHWNEFQLTSVKMVAFQG